MTMRAIKVFDYIGRRFNPGDIFEPAGDDGRALALAQLAVEIEDKPQKKKYKTRHLQAEDE